MKIAIAGKGGVGKTFISATLARLLTREGYNVLAVDADSNINLASSLGIPKATADQIVPISENKELVEERTGVAPGRSFGSMFRMTPTVDDIVDKFGIVGPDGVKLLVMGTVKAGDSGCMCPANALLRVLLQHLLIQRRDVVIMDMEAGVEHLGRGTARRVNAMLIVLEPTMKSVETATRVKALAKEIDVRDLLAVGNKIEGEREEKFISEKMSELGIPLLAFIPHDPSVAQADLLGKAPIDHDEYSPAIRALRDIKELLKKKYSF